MGYATPAIAFVFVAMIPTACSVAETKSVEASLAEAQFVGRIWVREGHQSVYVGEDGVKTACGQGYRADVLEQIMGRKSESVEFASVHNLRIGLEYVVALRDSASMPSIDVVRTPSQQRTDCERSLPLAKDDWMFTSGFAEGDSGWVALNRRMQVPSGLRLAEYIVKVVEVDGESGDPFSVAYADLLPFDVSFGGTFVEWSSFKAYLIEETRRTESRSD